MLAQYLLYLVGGVFHYVALNIVFDGLLLLQGSAAPSADECQGGALYTQLQLQGACCRLAFG